MSNSALQSLLILSAACLAANPMNADEVVIPKPNSVVVTTGTWNQALGLSPDFDQASLGLKPRIEQVLANHSLPAGIPLQIRLDLPSDSGGTEGYQLQVGPNQWVLRAAHVNGLWFGTQTIEQLLASEAELNGQIVYDVPAASWRGLMLDLARNFMPLSYLKSTVDRMTKLKLNRLHLHLTDDQGWRIEIKSHPQLALKGSQSSVGGSEGYLTQAEYTELVNYAMARGIAIVPEIDLPGHSNALTSVYPEHRCGQDKGWPYSGIDVGKTVICHTPESMALVGDILREVAALTPTPWIHFGGDEVQLSTTVPYATTIQALDSITAGLGKIAVGWEEITKGTTLKSTTIWQKWNPSFRGPNSQPWINSVCSGAYLDHPESSGSGGLTWCGTVISENSVYNLSRGSVGVEAALWGELVPDTNTSLNRLYPRVIALSEAGWTTSKNFNSYSTRKQILGETWFQNVTTNPGIITPMLANGSTSQPSRIQIFDLTGRWIMDHEGTWESLSLQGLSSGLYLGVRGHETKAIRTEP